MVTESEMDRMADMDHRVDYLGLNGNFGNELETILRGKHSQEVSGRERDFSMYRSGSAPPTVEGSFNAVNDLFRNSDHREASGSGRNNINGVLSEDEIRRHPEYLSYYYSHERINPRLPPPLLTKEDWRVAQRFREGSSSFSGVGDWRNNTLVNDNSGSSSLFSTQPGLSSKQAEIDLMNVRMAAGRDLPRNTSAEWVDGDTDGLIGLSSTGLGSRRKSFADIVQGSSDRPTYLAGHLSRPASRNALGDIVNTSGSLDSLRGDLRNAVEGIRTGASSSSLVRSQNMGTMGTHSFAPAVGSSLSRSTTPEPQLVGRPPGSSLPPVGSRVFSVGKKNVSGSNIRNGSSDMSPLSDLTATFSGLALSSDRHLDLDNHASPQVHAGFDNNPDIDFNMPCSHTQNLQQQLLDNSETDKLAASTNYIDLASNSGHITDVINSTIGHDAHLNFPRRTSSSANLYRNVNSSGSASFDASPIHHRNADISSSNFTDHMSNAYYEKLNSSFGSTLISNSEGRDLNRNQNNAFPNPQSQYMDPRFVQYLQKNSDYATRAEISPNGPLVRNNNDSSHDDFLRIQKAYLEALLAQQRQHHELTRRITSASLNHGYHGISSHDIGMLHQRSLMDNSIPPYVGSGYSMLQNERMSHMTSMMRKSMDPSIGKWNPDTGIDVEGKFGSSLLEEFKNNKTRAFELSDICDHVVEFSTDQFGSRFIQQKLETATDYEKIKIFREIIPHAHNLMTDVFGNYVIQKFLEHGTENQREELASQLRGHVLPLSLQMYGCRVIQKALEVVDMEHKIQMVAELDGAIMKCVHDQNGNHVIQKCIECVPQVQIQFIISSFYGQVLTLSTHPYGCRVIQRVLEHCNDYSTQQIIMEEVMQSVCTLAQDQYGNYVIQHVLQHGKPHERSVIIGKLAGQIVKMSQQKFASNVIEKCLTFGGPEERQLLVNEMLGTTDENEPLQAMMKDPFGNYVVQKVLEICDDQSLELIVSRIKVHLTTLKRYTYGKHIVSRVEKLIATGEKRIGLSASPSS